MFQLCTALPCPPCKDGGYRFDRYGEPFHSAFEYNDITSTEPSEQWSIDLNLPLWSPAVINADDYMFVAASATSDNGVAELSMLEYKESTGDVDLVWSKFLFTGGLVYGSPIHAYEYVSDTRKVPVVYVAASAETNVGSNTYIYAFDANTTLTNSAVYRWRYPTLYSKFYSGIGQVYSAGVINLKGTLFYGTSALSIDRDFPGSNGILALTTNASFTGGDPVEELWFYTYNSGVESVLVDEERVYGITSNGNMIAVDADTGALRWETNLDLGNVSSAVTVAGKASFSPKFAQDVIACFGEYILSLNRGTGAVSWSAKVNGNIRSAPALTNRKMFVGTESAALYYFKISRLNDEALPLWQVSMNSGIFSSPVIMGRGSTTDSVVALDVTGELAAFSIKSGKELWNTQVAEENFNTRNGGQPIVDRGGKIIIGTPVSTVRPPCVCVYVVRVVLRLLDPRSFSF